jgi:NADH-quinone oxidoreductase subunit M
VIYERTHDRRSQDGRPLDADVVYAVAFGFCARVGWPGGPVGIVGEFLSLVGAFIFSLRRRRRDGSMVLAAAYLLWMYQRLFFGEVSDFLAGLGHHLTDVTATEVLTLAPLAALVVVFGLFPGLILDLISGSVTNVLADVASQPPVDVAPEIAAIALLAVAAYVIARVAYVSYADAQKASDAGGGSALGAAGAGK